MNHFEMINISLKTMGLPAFISMRELKERYRLLANQNHPDLNGSQEKMAEINDAYNLLKEYMYSYKFSFSKDEINRQFPQDEYVSRFRF